MTTITRQVRDISAADRVALEHVLGISLRDDQCVMFQVQAPPAQGPGPPAAQLLELPEYLKLYEGSTDEEIARIESAILKRDRNSRSFE